MSKRRERPTGRESGALALRSRFARSVPLRGRSLSAQRRNLLLAEHETEARRPP